MIPSPTLFRPLCVATGSYFLLLLLKLLWRGLLDVGVPSRRPVGVFLATIPCYDPVYRNWSKWWRYFFLFFPRIVSASPTTCFNLFWQGCHLLGKSISMLAAIAFSFSFGCFVDDPNGPDSVNWCWSSKDIRAVRVGALHQAPSFPLQRAALCSPSTAVLQWTDEGPCQ